MRRFLIGMCVAALLVGSQVSGSASAAGVRTAARPAVATDGGTFVPLTPARLLDTRTGVGGTTPGPNGTVALVVAGRGGVPAASGVSSVVLTVTVAGPKSQGFVVAYAHGGGAPTTSNLNFNAGQTVANLVIVPVGSGGMVDLSNRSTSANNLIADVSGYYRSGTPTEPGSFQGLSSQRVLDTRVGLGGTSPASGGTVALTLLGKVGIPASGVSAVALNVTAAGPVAPGYVTAYPHGAARPLASDVSFSAGRNVAGLVIVQLGSTGAIDLYNGSTAKVGLVADVAGYFVGGTATATGAYTSLVASRLLDTRIGSGGATPAPHGTVAVKVTGRGGVPSSGVTAVALTVTAVNPTTPGYVTAFADGSTRPLASNVTYATGQTTADLVLVPVGSDGEVDLYNGASARTALVADVKGYVTGVVKPLAWGAPVPVDPIVGQVYSVSCATQTFCVAGDLTGHALVYRSGTWSKPTMVDPGHGLRLVSCVSSTFCVATDEVGDYATFDGATWSTPALADTTRRFVDGLSCRSTTFCVAVDDTGHGVVFNGSSWSAPAPIEPNGNAVTTVSCATTTWCLAVDEFSASYVYNGTAWSAGTSFPGIQATSVSCVSPTFCAAVDGSGSAYTYNGTAWTLGASYSNVNGFNGISCATATYCLASDNFGSSVTYSGGVWGNEQTTEGNVLSAVSCPGGPVCQGIAGGESSLTYNGSSWGVPAVIDATHGGAISVSCASSTFCAMVDTRAAEMTYDGTGWTAPQRVGTGFEYPPSSLSCPSASFCRAVTDFPTDFNGNLLTFNGSTWTTTHDLDGEYVGVSCPSSTFCAAASVFGPVAVYHGAGWTSAPTGISVLSGISCTSATFCVATNRSGQAVRYNGSSWAAPVHFDTAATPGRPQVSCPTSSFCVAADGNGTVFTFNGASWSTGAPVDAGNPIAAVSCSSANSCAAVDSNGSLVTFDGNAWSTPDALDPSGGGFVSVSCPSDFFCVALDAQGNTFTRS